MKKLLRKYPEAALAILALIIIAAMFYAFTWGVGDVVGALNRAVNAKSGEPGNVGFNLQGAKQLDLRGLVNPGQ